MLHQNSPISSTPPRLLILAGPTASGKSQVGLELCEILDGEIISADSLLIYRGLNIGTAKPTGAQRALVPHHLIDILEPDDAEYSAAQWAADATRLIQEISSREKQPIIVGGTGFYMTALLSSQRLASAPPNPVLRAEMENLAVRLGKGVLHAHLREMDEAAANRLHPNDVMRVTRAIEVAQWRLQNKLQGDNCDDGKTNHLPTGSRLEYSAFALELSREKLYARINARVDAMLDEGFLDELKTLLVKGYGEAAPLQSLGYRQMRAALLDPLQSDDCVEVWKRQTRRYAKRQLTWFAHQLDVRWIKAEDADGEMKSAKELAHQIAAEFLGSDG